MRITPTKIALLVASLCISVAAYAAIPEKSAAPAAATTVAGVPSIESIMADRVLGDVKAPVTIIEYASFTCPHCADFAKESWPEIEKQAIDSGTAKLIYRDFPLDGIALRASAVARCLPHEQYYPFIKLLFARQAQWSAAADPTVALAQLAALAGLSPDIAKACMTDPKILDAIAQGRLAATEKYKVNATPTFVLNDGAEVIPGAMETGKFMARINALATHKMLPNSTAPAAAAPVAPPVSTPIQNPVK